MKLIDRDKIPYVQDVTYMKDYDYAYRYAIEAEPTVDAIPIEWIFDWENRYMNALPPEFQGETIIEDFIEDWRKEQEKQNESTV